MIYGLIYNHQHAYTLQMYVDILLQNFFPNVDTSLSISSLSLSHTHAQNIHAHTRIYTHVLIYTPTLRHKRTKLLCACVYLSLFWIIFPPFALFSPSQVSVSHRSQHSSQNISLPSLLRSFTSQFSFVHLPHNNRGTF